jgi:hypothetical protein
LQFAKECGSDTPHRFVDAAIIVRSHVPAQKIVVPQRQVGCRQFETNLE